MKTSNNKRFSDNLFDQANVLKSSEKGLLKEGMEAFRLGQSFNEEAPLEWRIGWNRARFKKEKEQQGIS